MEMCLVSGILISFSGFWLCLIKREFCGFWCVVGIDRKELLQAVREMVGFGKIDKSRWTKKRTGL